MAKPETRNIGSEILKGIREIKRGEIGRVLTVPPVAETRAPVDNAVALQASLAVSREDDLAAED